MIYGCTSRFSAPFFALETNQEQCSTSVLSNFPSHQYILSECALPTGTAHSLVVNPDLYLDIVWECYMQNRLSALLLICSDWVSGDIPCCLVQQHKPMLTISRASLQFACLRPLYCTSVLVGAHASPFLDSFTHYGYTLKTFK